MYYNVIFKVLTSTGAKFMKYRKVNKLDQLIQYVERKGNKVEYINLYDYKTKEKIRSYKYKD